MFFLFFHFFLFRRKVSTIPDNISCVNDTATSTPSKKLKPSLPSNSPAENLPYQNSPSFHQIANNTLLQQSMFILHFFYKLICIKSC